MTKPDTQPGATRLSTLFGDWPPGTGATSLPIGILPGEGVGPEVIGACQPILQAIETHTAYRFRLEYGGEIGTAARRESGEALTAEVADFCQRCFARGGPVFCGPGGDRFVYQLRKKFDIYCKFVPLQPLAALRDTGALRPEAVRNVDILLLRENVGGLYQGDWQLARESNGLKAHHAFSYSEQQVARVMQLAVKAAARRRGQLCVIHKPGGAPAISELWVEVAHRCADNQGIELRFLEVDTAAYLLLADAVAFDVVVTSNMFGDVLADAAALLLGSRGMSYSSNLGDGGVAVYQTGHGAAYDLAGTQRANPLGQIQSLAMLLRDSFGLDSLARNIVTACDTTLAAGWRTVDIAAPGSHVVGTQEMGIAVAGELSRRLATHARPTAIHGPG